MPTPRRPPAGPPPQPAGGELRTDLIVVGAGAGGLMAAVTAAADGLRVVLVERKHQPGRKLLMCANNRCNLTNNLPVEEMLAAYGEPVATFLRPAIAAFSPKELRDWLRQNGMRTTVHQDGKVFPASEKSADVLHLFTDLLRQHTVPTLFNATVEGVVPQADGFLVAGASFALRGRRVLLATGGVSYPKTGSVGDGQRFAKALGHKLAPYQPGLVGFEIRETWLQPATPVAFPGTRLTVLAGNRPLGSVEGEIECSCRGLRGPAVVDASRLVARSTATEHRFFVDLAPRSTTPALAEQLARRLERADGKLVAALADWLLPASLARRFVAEVLPGRLSPEEVAARLKAWEIRPLKPRPLKEAMVTIGGVALAEVDPETLESRRCPGLHFAGEVLDIDGPTGGFNLHAAFATARLAVRHCATADGAGTAAAAAATGQAGRSGQSHPN